MTAAQNTKVELVVESFEDLANAIISRRNATAFTPPSIVDGLATAVIDARATLTEALRSFMVPSLRVIEGGNQGYSPDTLVSEIVTCPSCLKTTPCKRNCKDWHDAIKATIAKQPGVA